MPQTEIFHTEVPRSATFCSTLCKTTPTASSSGAATAPSLSPKIQTQPRVQQVYPLFTRTTTRRSPAGLESISPGRHNCLVAVEWPVPRDGERINSLRRTGFKFFCYAGFAFEGTSFRPANTRYLRSGPAATLGSNLPCCYSRQRRPSASDFSAAVFRTGDRASSMDLRSCVKRPRAQRRCLLRHTHLA